MSKKLIFFESNHKINFFELDPYNHLGTAEYARYYVNHRMIGLREYIGWDLKALSNLPFMVWIKRMEVDFLQSAPGNNKIRIRTNIIREQTPGFYQKHGFKSSKTQKVFDKIFQPPG